LPPDIQKLAEKNYVLWCEDQRHPSLHFKQLGGGTNRYSVRIGLHYRALAKRQENGDYVWVWIGSHAEYDRLVRSN